MTVTLPWKFIPLQLLGGTVPLTTGTQNFVDFCLEPNPLQAFADGTLGVGESLESLGLRDVVHDYFTSIEPGQ